MVTGCFSRAQPEVPTGILEVRRAIYQDLKPVVVTVETGGNHSQLGYLSGEVQCF